MDFDPRLVRRIKRPSKRMIGSHYRYFPREISRTDKLNVGQKVEIVGIAFGEKKGFEIATVRSLTFSDSDNLIEILLSDLGL